ncbi:NAD-dependent deacetylase [Trinickia symbiotica]|uniref:protein acetyllysine N-acetyltransferase n=1 Tax=Trinickia symbiotica TaxID=863227 RepID=A0A2T3XP13_9BURK|nr:Sir2 family NAD-dependent protein deacetylase [Trinickia symbiotica]PTB18259.1 NAD-dependent deacetylase [Trinickia symbiotica]
MDELQLTQAADWIRDADGLLITAGAGIGIDSGLPDFRGPEGFWRAYPALRAEGLTFTEIANPAAFLRDPRLAWGFYGHRLNLYRATVPHEGFQILKRWGEACAQGAFVFTSNVDGQFQKAGFPPGQLAECHGSIQFLQCMGSCTESRWSASGFAPDVDAQAARLRSPLPRCPSCGGIARPNILMFEDYNWVGWRYDELVERARTWLRGLQRPVTIEIGAGTAIPTVRRFGERTTGPLIRINPDECAISRSNAVELRGGALDVLQRLDQMLGRR